MNAAFLLVALVVSGTLALLRELGPAWMGGLAVALLVASRFDPIAEPVRREPFTRAALGWGLAACAPVAFALVTTWTEDFPQSGDNPHHMLMARQSFVFWKTWWLPAFGAVVALLAYRRTRLVRLGGPVLLVAAALLVHGELREMVFATRYPGAFHFLVFPFQALGRAVDTAYPVTVLRVVTALSVPGWLFVLRPVFLGRWPSAHAFVFALLFFFQKDVVYFVTSPYLEPWSLVFVLVAVEHVFVFGERNAWRAVLLVGFGAMFKEQAILVLPFLALAAWDKRLASIPRAAFEVVWAALPFVVYYALRKKAAHWRTVGSAPAAAIFDTERLSTFARRAWIHLGPTLGVLVALVLAALVLAHRTRERRRLLVLLPAGALFQVVFFYADAISVPWTGYPRFHVFAHLLVASLVFHPRWGELFSIPTERAVVGVAGALQAVTLLPFLALCAGDEVRRNFFEHTDAPIFLPVRPAVREAEKMPGWSAVRRLKLVGDMVKVLPCCAPYVDDGLYPDIGAHHAFDFRMTSDDPATCACTEAEEATLGLFVYFGNLSREAPSRSAAETMRAACLATMRDRCADVRVHEVDGQPVYAVGLGLR